MASLQLKVMLNTTGTGTRWNSASTGWTDISAYVRVSEGVQVRTGRSTERAKITPSTATLTLDNTTRRFDPTYAAGPYYGYLKVNTPIAIAVFDDDSATYVNIFRGFVVSGFPVREQFNAVSTVTITCGDALALATNAIPTQSDHQFTITDGQYTAGTVNYKRSWWLPFTDAGRTTDSTGTKSIDLVGSGSQVDSLTVGGTPAVSIPDNQYWSHTDQAMLMPSNPTTTDCTIEMWAKIDADDTGSTNLYREHHGLASAVPPKFTVYASSSAIGVNCVVGTSWLVCNALNTNDAPFQIKDNVPHHIVCVLSGAVSNWKIYLDGVALGTATQTSVTTAVTFAEARIGLSYSATPSATVVQDLQIWQNYALTAADVAGRYQAGKGLSYNTVSELLRKSVRRMADSGGAPTTVFQGMDAVGRMVTAPYLSYGKSNVKDLLQVYEDTEQGVVDTRPDTNSSVIRFTDRMGFTSNGSPYLTFTDNGTGSIGYLGESFVSEFDPLDLENVSSVTRLGGQPQIVRNETSIGEAGERTLDTLTDLVLTSDRQAQSIAQWRNFIYSTPKKRIKQLKVMPLNSASVYTTQIVKKLAEIAPSSLIRVDRNRGASLETVYGHVYGTEWNIVEGVLTVTLNISAVRYQPFSGWGTLTWGGNWEN